MKRVAKVKGGWSDFDVEVQVRVNSRQGLTRDEVTTVVDRLADDAMKSLATMPYRAVALSDQRVSK